MNRTKGLYLPCMLSIFFFTLFTFNAKAQNLQQSQNLSFFESNLNLFEARVNDADAIWWQLAGEIKGAANANVMNTQLAQLRNRMNGLSSFAFQLRYYANALNSRNLIRGVSQLTREQNAGFNATIAAINAFNSGTLITQHLIPIETAIDEMLRITNDCLRREIQVIRRNL